MKIFVLALFSLFFHPSNSEIKDECTLELSGVVVEEDTGEPLTGALVQIEGIKNEIYTDLNGHFSVAVIESGTYNIKISYISFESKELKAVQITPENSHLFISLR